MGGGLKETEEGQKNSNKKSKNDFQVCIGKLIIISRWQKKSRNTDTAKWENKSISHTEMNNNMLRYKIN